MYIFSDDLSKSERNYIGSKKFPQKFSCVESDSFQSLKMMVECEYHILHVSTFSFWSAFLDINQPNSKVFYPESFTNTHSSSMIPYQRMENDLMDKNKSAFKLKNIGPIYYINLDGQPERKQYMEELFKYWEIENYERVSGYDGRDDDLSDILKGRYPEQMTSGEVGCTTSHLKAIKHWYETSDTPMLSSWKMI